MKIIPTSPMGGMGDDRSRRRGALSIRHVGGDKVEYAVTEMPGGERVEGLDEKEAWELYKVLNGGLVA